MSQQAFDPRPLRRDLAVLVGGIPKGRAGDPNRSLDRSLDELEGLANAVGIRGVARIGQALARPHPATYFGSGKVEEIALAVVSAGGRQDALVIADNELTGAQVRNLERRVGTRVVDRTELILDIFATNARTRQARLQVELAQLEYAKPRLRRMWTHLERIEGGTGMRGGAGEKQIELDRRMIAQRIRDLRHALSEIRARKEREVDARAGEYTVGLVGYTNAGKSTLLNRLTGARVLTADRLFSTLDTRTRVWDLDGYQHVLLSDTVGFIRDLPHHLVEAFHATLEEATRADLLLHVVDASDPDPLAQARSVTQVLETLGLAERLAIVVLNKIDEVREPGLLAALRSAVGEHVAVSARTGQGLDHLAAKVTAHRSRSLVEVDIRLPLGDGRRLALIAECGRVLSRAYEADAVVVRARLSPADHARIVSGLDVAPV